MIHNIPSLVRHLAACVKVPGGTDYAAWCSHLSHPSHICPHFCPRFLPCSWQDTNQVEYVLQLGALSMVPFLAEQVLERGLTDALLNTLHQVGGCAWN